MTNEWTIQKGKVNDQCLIAYYPDKLESLKIKINKKSMGDLTRGNKHK